MELDQKVKLEEIHLDLVQDLDLDLAKAKIKVKIKIELDKTE